MKGLTRLVQDTDGGLDALLNSLEADVICFQETKLASRQALVKAPHLYFSSNWDGVFGFCTQAIGQQAVRGYRSTSYAGTATYVRKNANSFVVAAADRMGEPLRDHSGSAISQSRSGSESGTPGNSQDDNLNSETIPSDILRFTGDDNKEWNVDSEGRVIITLHSVAPEGSPVAIVNVYAPASNREEEREGFKKAFHDSLSFRLMQLYSTGFRSIILCGDLNAIAGPLDVHTGNGMRREHVVAGYWDHEKPAGSVQWLRSLLRSFTSTKKPSVLSSNQALEYVQNERQDNLFTDAFRVLYPDRDGAYTCWSTVKRHRETNCGTRLDFFLLSSGFSCGEKNHSPVSSASMRCSSTFRSNGGSCFGNTSPSFQLVDCDIWPEVQGSDHCPVWMAFRKVGSQNEEVGEAGKNCDVGGRNFPEAMPHLFVSQWPEFRGRQQKIGDMFGPQAKATTAAPPKPPTPSAGMNQLPSVGTKHVSKKQKVTLHSFFGAAKTSNAPQKERTTKPDNVDEKSSAASSLEESGEKLDSDLQEALRQSLETAREESLPTSENSKGQASIPSDKNVSALSINDVFRKARSLAAAKRPNCLHGHLARLYNVKDRKSEHYGRRFWSCDHELHPNGDWKSNPVASNRARCSFFKWDAAYKGYKNAK